jgi:hypothetical protein
MTTDCESKPAVAIPESFRGLKCCSICRELKPLNEFHRRRYHVRGGYRAACKACTAEANKRRQQREPTTAEAKWKHQQDAVRRRTKYAIRKGWLLPQPCSVCGAADADTHHPNYTGPNAHLEVVWLCRTHHAWAHATSGWVQDLVRQLDLPF